jgi:Sialidase, N-terminal domain.
MKANWRIPGFLVGLMLCLHCANAAKTSTNQTGLRLTVELQDGSRIIGKNGDETFQFRSDVLGEIKLPLEKIRSIECQPKTNLVKLTTANGDTLAAQFTMKEVRVESAFGNFKLPVNLIRRVQVSATGKSRTDRSGLVALWSGDGNGDDLVGGHKATLTDVSSDQGKVGQAFSLNGSSSYLKIPASATLNLGERQSFTIMAWIKPSDVSQLHPLFEWNAGDGNSWGMHFFISVDGGPGALYANMVDTHGSWHQIHSMNGVVTTRDFQHVALTYDKTSGMAKIYCNGTVVAQEDIGSLMPLTTYDLYLGKRPLTQGETYSYEGLLDEIAIYNRALSAAEIQEICTEDNHGEPLPTPPAVSPGIKPPRARTLDF